MGPQAPSEDGPARHASPVPCPGETVGLVGSISVSAPAAGSAYAVGEALDHPAFDRPLRQPAFGQQPRHRQPLPSGPRQPLLTKTASALLNCVVDRAASDRQHHFINLIAPKYADPSKGNLRSDADGTLHYRLSAISSEPSGTYAIGLWAKSKMSSIRSLSWGHPDRHPDGGVVHLGAG